MVVALLQSLQDVLRQDESVVHLYIGVLVGNEDIILLRDFSVRYSYAKQYIS